MAIIKIAILTKTAGKETISPAAEVLSGSGIEVSAKLDRFLSNLAPNAQNWDRS